MGKLPLMAVRALREPGRCQKIMAAALCSSLLGVAPFRIRHCSIPLSSPIAAYACEIGFKLNKYDLLALRLDPEVLCEPSKRRPACVGLSLVAVAGT